MSIYCERCGARIEAEDVRYLVTIHATADFDDKLPSGGDIGDLEAVMRQIDKKSAEEHEHDVYQSKGFILCTGCKNIFMKNPLNLPQGNTPGGDDDEGRVH